MNFESIKIIIADTSTIPRIVPGLIYTISNTHV